MQAIKYDITDTHNIEFIQLMNHSDRLKNELHIAFKIRAQHHQPMVVGWLKLLTELLLNIFVFENQRPTLQQVLNDKFFESEKYYHTSFSYDTKSLQSNNHSNNTELINQVSLATAHSNNSMNVIKPPNINDSLIGNSSSMSNVSLVSNSSYGVAGVGGSVAGVGGRYSASVGGGGGGGVIGAMSSIQSKGPSFMSAKGHGSGSGSGGGVGLYNVNNNANKLKYIKPNMKMSKSYDYINTSHSKNNDSNNNQNENENENENTENEDSYNKNSRETVELGVARSAAATVGVNRKSAMNYAYAGSAGSARSAGYV